MAGVFRAPDRFLTLPLARQGRLFPAEGLLSLPLALLEFTPPLRFAAFGFADALGLGGLEARRGAPEQLGGGGEVATFERAGRRPGIGARGVECCDAELRGPSGERRLLGSCGAGSRLLNGSPCFLARRRPSRLECLGSFGEQSACGREILSLERTRGALGDRVRLPEPDRR